MMIYYNSEKNDSTVSSFRQNMNRLLISIIAFLSLIGLTACSEQSQTVVKNKSSIKESTYYLFEEVEWTDLEPASQAALPQYLPEDLSNFGADPNFDELDEEQTLDPTGLSLPQPYLSSAKAIEELDGRAIKIPGFVVPLEFEGNLVTEFFLVPYFGACYHRIKLFISPVAKGLILRIFMIQFG